MPTSRHFLVVVPTRDPKKQLEFLYARRGALDAVIRLLEEYNRCRVRRLEPGNRKTA